ncbi:MAG: glutamyl-tRNA reductase [Candidatus Omnitrophica bacterium]|nr:glutamyl-tRNA reductase [Candidatus Omnitrophota bacterium]
MYVICMGISHRTCPVDIREKYYLHPADKDMLLDEFQACPSVNEAIIISTCNRTEIYAVLTVNQPHLLLELLCHVKGVHDPETDLNCFYAYSGEKAIRHLLRVAAGLDSLIIGEKEILGQVKAAIELARTHRMTGPFLNILFNLTIRTGKLARNQTEIGRGGVSVSWAAVELIRKTVPELRHSSVLIIGAGKMSRLAIGDLKRKGAEKVYVMNRTRSKGEQLAETFGAATLPLEDLAQVLPRVDICICSSSAPYYLIDRETVKTACRQRDKGLLLIDLSVPRNIDPATADIPGVTLVGVDELDRVVAYNVRKRLAAAYEVEKIITAKIREFYRKLSTRSQYLNNKEKDSQQRKAVLSL